MCLTAIGCFYSPIGYKYERVSGHGKLLVRDEPTASIVQQALSGFASGRFETVAEVKRFLEQFPEYPLKLWESECVEQRRMLLRMAFTDKITYDRSQGFRTAAMSQPFSLLEDLKGGKKEMVEGRGATSNQLFEILEKCEILLKKVA